MEKDKKTLNKKALLVALISLILVVLVAGCGGSSGTNSSQQNNNQSIGSDQDIAQNGEQEIEKEDDQSSESKDEPKDNEQTDDGKTVEGIMASVSESGFLDGRHINGGLDCSTCHGGDLTLLDADIPAADKPIPTQQECLSCHTGSYEELAKTTNILGESNPHDSHEGQIACSFCHTVHEPFQRYCDSCHDSGGLGSKYL